MVPYSRNIPWWSQDAPPRDCENCRLQANWHLAVGAVTLQREGFIGYGDEKRWYRRRTITASYSSHVTGFYPGEYTDRDGSITLVYEMTLSGEVRLIAASGSWSYEDLDRTPIYDPEDPDTIIGYDDNLTNLSAAVSYNAAGGSGLGSFSWTGTAAGIVPSAFGQIPTSPPDSISGDGDERSWTAAVDGGTWVTTETLSEEYDDEMLRENAEALLAAIDLNAMELAGSSVTARYGGVGPYRSLAPFDFAIEVAEAAISAAEINLAGAVAEASIAETAWEDALEGVTAARGEVHPAWQAAMEARGDLEAVLVRIETWRRRGDAAQLAAAEADLAEAIEEWEASRGQWEEKMHELEVAIDACRLAKAMAAYAQYLVAFSERSLLNAEYFLTLAEYNKSVGAEWDAILLEPGGDGLPRRVENRDLDGNIESIELAKAAFEFYWIHPSSWSRPPQKLAVDWRLAFLTDTASHTEEATDEITLVETALVAFGGSHSINAPSSEGYVVIAGKASRGTISWNPEARGGAARKMGFLAYDGAPRYYLTETAGGSFPGCPLQSLPTKSYSGSQVYDPAPDDIDNWQGGDTPGAVVESFSADVPATRRSIVPSPDPYRTGEGTPAHEEFLDRGEILSGTQRRWVSTVQCGENTLQDLQTLTLSDEFTTAALRALVDPVYEQPFGEAVTLFPPEAYSLDRRFAIHWLSPAEDYYVRIRLRGTFQWIPPGGSSGYFPTPPTLSMQWKRIEIDLETGERNETIQTATLNDGATSPILIEPEEGKCYEIGPAQLSDDHPTMWDLPIWRPVCEESGSEV